MSTFNEVLLVIFATISTIIGILTLISKERGEYWWKRTSSLATILVLNTFIILSLGLVKIYLDNIKSDEKDLKISSLQRNISQSLAEQKALKFQLSNVESKLRSTIEIANERELQYYKDKDSQNSDNWISAFKAEEKLNLELLNFLSSQMNSSNRIGFLYQPDYLQINYLGSLMSSPHTDSQFQLSKMTMLYSKLNEINSQIKAGSTAVTIGNYDGSMAGFSRINGIENNATYALLLYKAISGGL